MLTVVCIKVYPTWNLNDTVTEACNKQITESQKKKKAKAMKNKTAGVTYLHLVIFLDFLEMSKHLIGIIEAEYHAKEILQKSRQSNWKA